MTISNSTLSVDIWNHFRTTLVASAPYITNSTTSATTAASILAQYNDKNPTKPQVVIMPVEYEKAIDKFGTFSGRAAISVTVECYASNSLSVDQLADQVQNSIEGNIPDEIDLIATSHDYAFTNPQEVKYHMKGITFSFLKE